MTDTVTSLDRLDALDTLSAIIAGYFKKKRLELFLESVAAVRESMELGGWVPGRGRQKASKGFSKGLASHKAVERPQNYSDPRHKPLFNCYMAVSYGWNVRQNDLDLVTDEDLVCLCPKVPVPVTRTWLQLMVLIRDVFDELDASRPVPVLSEIGLSPKVTQTLLDATIGLDLNTRRICPLGWYWGTETDKHGRSYKVKVYYPKWPEDTRFGSSRFSHCDCQACGKHIPSGRVVPIIIQDSDAVSHGFWFGVDCARNILGIKDAGIEKGQEPA